MKLKNFNTRYLPITIRFMISALCVRFCIQPAYSQKTDEIADITLLSPRIHINSIYPQPESKNRGRYYTFARGYLVNNKLTDTMKIAEKVELTRLIGWPNVTIHHEKPQLSRTESFTKQSSIKGPPYLLTSDRGNPFLDSLSLWNCEQPFLYDIKITSILNNVITKDTTIRQGVKSFNVVSNQAFLNKKKIKIKKINYASNGKSKSEIRNDLVSLKSNFVNTLIIPKYDTTLLNLCDQIGMYGEHKKAWGETAITIL